MLQLYVSKSSWARMTDGFHPSVDPTVIRARAEEAVSKQICSETKGSSQRSLVNDGFLHFIDKFDH